MKKLTSEASSAVPVCPDQSPMPAGCDGKGSRAASEVVLGPILREPGGFLYELTEARGRGPENRWWAHIETQHGHMTDEQRDELAILFAAAPAMRDLLREADLALSWVEEDERDQMNRVSTESRARQLRHAIARVLGEVSR